MRSYLIVLIPILLVYCLGVAIGNFFPMYPHHHSYHECHSPCVVYFPDHTEEDEWYVDYGWKDRHTPILGVKTCPIGDMSGRCG